MGHYCHQVRRLLVGGGFMKEVTELIEALQQRLKNAGGGEIIITDKKFDIKLTGNTTSFVSKTRNL